MKPAIFTREQLYDLFRADKHPSLDNALARDDVHGLAVYHEADGRPVATPAQSATLPVLDAKGRKLAGVYMKDKTRLALDYLATHPGTTPYAAARQFGVAKQVLYRALHREAKRQQKAAHPVCPCCGQPIPVTADETDRK